MVAISARADRRGRGAHRADDRREPSRRARGRRGRVRALHAVGRRVRRACSTAGTSSSRCSRSAWLLTLDDRAWTQSPRSQWIVADRDRRAARARRADDPPVVRRRDRDRHRRARARRAARRGSRRRRTKLAASRSSIAAVGAFVDARRSGTCSAAASPSSGRAGGPTRATRTAGIGLSLGQELARGWHNAYGYYQHRPLLFLMILAFVGVTVAEWPNFDRKIRVVHLALLGWLAGGWFQLVSGERYSTHYFSVIAAPTAMIGAALAGHAFAAVATRPRVIANHGRVAAARACCSRSICRPARPTGCIDAASITSGFTSVAARGASSTRANQPGPEPVGAGRARSRVPRPRSAARLLRRPVPLSPSTGGSPRRASSSATSSSARSTSGETSPKYILHDTWKWFDDDLRQTNPAAFLETGARRLEAVRRVRGRRTSRRRSTGRPAPSSSATTSPNRCCTARPTAVWAPPVEPERPGLDASTGTRPATAGLDAGGSRRPARARDASVSSASTGSDRHAGRLAPRVVFHFEDSDRKRHGAEDRGRR